MLSPRRDGVAGTGVPGGKEKEPSVPLVMVPELSRTAGFVDAIAVFVGVGAIAGFVGAIAGGDEKWLVGGARVAKRKEKGVVVPWFVVPGVVGAGFIVDAIAGGGTGVPDGDEKGLVGGAGVPDGDEKGLVGGAGVPDGNEKGFVGGAGVPDGDEKGLVVPLSKRRDGVVGAGFIVGVPDGNEKGFGVPLPNVGAGFVDAIVGGAGVPDGKEKTRLVVLLFMVSAKLSMVSSESSFLSS